MNLDKIITNNPEFNLKKSRYEYKTPMVDKDKVKPQKKKKIENQERNPRWYGKITK